MESNWVDFKGVKAAVSMEMILTRYRINWLGKKNDELRGRCPIHQGEGDGAFHVSLTKNAFQCFSCKARGNVLDFVAAMEKCSVRDAALKLQEWFLLSKASEHSDAQTSKHLLAAEDRGEDKPVNPPLTFQLKGVDHSHAYLAGRGIMQETAESFGVGFFSGRGSMSGRVVIPIHDGRGHLVAYAGRSVDNREPRYKLPVGFHKSRVLYNLHRVTAQEVIVVEGFFDCMKVWQSLHPFVVALMGSSLSEHQEQLLLKQFKKVTLLLDGDTAGKEAAEEIGARLIRRLHVRIVEVPDGKQPDMLTAEELDGLLRK